MKVKVHVTLKQSVLDPQGEAIKKGLASLGFDDVASVRLGKYFELEINNSSEKDLRSQVDVMCKKLLANPVIEEYTIDIIQET